MTKRSYSELIKLNTLWERFEYLKLTGKVGASTFGFDRYMNQWLYKSSRWKALRHEIIVRDEGCNLGMPGYEIFDMIIVHHMNPLTKEQVELNSPEIYDPNQLICVSHMTHMAIHYGDEKLLPPVVIEREPGDTNLW